MVTSGALKAALLTVALCSALGCGAQPVAAAPAAQPVASAEELARALAARETHIVVVDHLDIHPGDLKLFVYDETRSIRVRTCLAGLPDLCAHGPCCLEHVTLGSSCPAAARMQGNCTAPPQGAESQATPRLRPGQCQIRAPSKSASFVLSAGLRSLWIDNFATLGAPLLESLGTQTSVHEAPVVWLTRLTLMPRSQGAFYVDGSFRALVQGVALPCVCAITAAWRCSAAWTHRSVNAA